MNFRFLLKVLKVKKLIGIYISFCVVSILLRWMNGIFNKRLNHMESAIMLPGCPPSLIFTYKVDMSLNYTLSVLALLDFVVESFYNDYLLIFSFLSYYNRLPRILFRLILSIVLPFNLLVQRTAFS